MYADAGEIEMVTRYEPDAADAYRQLSDYLRDRHWQQIFSEDGSRVDDQVAQLLAIGRRIATAESSPADCCRPGSPSGPVHRRTSPADWWPTPMKPKPTCSASIRR